MRVYLSVCLSACLYVRYSRPNSWADHFHTWIRLDPGIVLGKSWSSSERRRREREGQKRSKCRIGEATEVEVKVKVP